MIPHDRFAVGLFGNGDNFNPDPVVEHIIATLYGVPLHVKPTPALSQSSPDARHARALLAGILHGTVATSGARDFAALHARLGSPLGITLTYRSGSAGITTYSYRVKFASDILQYDLSVTASGKLDGAAVEPWYDDEP